VFEEKDYMDRHFLEFWGNFLINAAKGQKQMEDMSKWMQQGFEGSIWLWSKNMRNSKKKLPLRKKP
jgi:hypothetical protein